MFKKAAAFVLATALALTMVACGQTADDANQTSASNQTAVSEEQTSAEAEPAAPQSDPAEQTQTEPAAPESDTTEPAATEEMPAEQMTDETDPAGQTSTEQTTPETDPTEQPADEQETQGDQTETQQSQTETTASADGKTLVAYFSRSGNTQEMASYIAEQTGGDLFRIETVQEYPGSHDPLLEFAYNERAEGARPELAAEMENLDSYDIIFLGYPNWNADLPMPLYTLLEQTDLSGKTIVPFTTHGGSGFSRTIQTIQELQPNATVVSDGLSISRNSVAQAEGDVASWVSGLGLIG